MFKFRIGLVLIVFLVFISAALIVRADEITFLHHFRTLEADLALGDPNPVQATAKIVPGGWDFRGKFPGSGVEVLNGTRLDFNAAGNIDWNIGSVEFWVMSYSDMRDATNHKFFCTPISHGTDEAVHIWKTAVADDLRIRVVSGANMDAVWAGVAEWKAKEWHHIAATWDHEDEGLNLYADGELVASNPAAMWEFKPGYATFSVGGQGGAVTTNGIIDELVIYDYVLSEEEVKEHFNAVQPPGDKAVLEMDDKLATTWGRLKGV